MTKLTKPIAPLAAAAAVLLGSALLAAQPLAAETPDTVRSVRIAIVDPSSGDDLAVLDPDQEITLIPGEEVLVKTFEPIATRNSDRRTVASTFGFGPSQREIEVVSSTPGRGEALIRLNDATPGQRLRIGYKLADHVPLANPSMRLGKILVRVASPGSRSVTGARSTTGIGGSGFGHYSTPADAVINALYRGILLRDPDSGAAGARDELVRNGYDAVRQVAGNIANSEESRYRLYDNGATNVRRLEALYSNLLGWSRADVGRDRWDSDLAELDRGNIAGVVDAIVRSQQFRSRFGI